MLKRQRDQRDREKEGWKARDREGRTEREKCGSVKKKSGREWTEGEVNEWAGKRWMTEEDEN